MLGLIGTDFRQADLQQRSRFAVSPSALPGLLGELQSSGVTSAVVLSTCNRAEILFSGDAELVAQAFSHHAGFDVAPHVQRRAGREVVEHLFRLSAGMESASLGETEIVSQLKEAWSESRKWQMARGSVDLVLRHAMQAGKRVRTETGLCRGVVSYATLAVREASARIGGFRGKTVAILGAGVMAERVIKELQRTPPGEVIVVNRTLANAQKLTAKYGGRAVAIDQLWRADAVFGCTSFAIPSTVVSQIGSAVAVDLGVPASMPAPYRTVGMDELVAKCAANASLRLAALTDADRIVAEEITKFEAEIRRRRQWAS